MNSSAITDWPLMTLGTLGKAVKEALGYFVSRLFCFYLPPVGKEQVAVEPLHEHDIGRTSSPHLSL
jgi:hypothetical protein